LGPPAIKSPHRHNRDPSCSPAVALEDAGTFLTAIVYQRYGGIAEYPQLSNGLLTKHLPPGKNEVEEQQQQSGEFYQPRRISDEYACSCKQSEQEKKRFEPGISPCLQM